MNDYNVSKHLCLSALIHKSINIRQPFKIDLSQDLRSGLIPGQEKRKDSAQGLLWERGLGNGLL